ncbi:MAG TPA: hypothetical protein VGD08_25015 [Stellaceae bacterium]|jgi:hypothetical protein
MPNEAASHYNPRGPIDDGALRDKVAAPDPGAAPLDADSETTGMPTPRDAERQADRAQAAAAQRAVPKLDRSREVATNVRGHLAPESMRAIVIAIGAAVLLVVAIGLLVYATLPG